MTTTTVAQKVEYQGSDKLILGIVLGVITFWLFAQSLVNVAPDIQRSVGIPLESLNLAISLTALFSGCFIVVAGGLADKFGRVKFTYIGFILSIIGSLCLIFASEAILFSVGRIIQGLSAACIMPATLALMKTFYEGAQRQRALSFWSIGSWGGSGVCSLAGGAIATYMGWRWIFIISIIIAILGMLLIKGTPESKMESSEKESKFDYTGLFFFVVSLVSLNLVITKGSSFGWTSVTTLSLAAVCLVTMIIFFIVEFGKRAGAFIDFSLFKNMPYSGATFSNFMLNAVAGTLLVANTYIQTGRGFTPFQTGMLSIGYLIAVLGMIRVGEKVLQKVGAKKPMLFGTTITGIGVALMALTSLPDTLYIVAVFVGFVLFGLGLGFYATPSTDTAISNAPADKVGVASGIYKMASSLGGAFGVAISASVYAAFLAVGASTETAATIGLLVNVGFCVLSALSIIILVPKDAGMSKVVK
ncbi:MFS transporter [Zophobihabitans entericus]|uniref:MFS transporter n=1 Tax=Zophobihabitans entericus TaxID=1635327 RepID=A0A6G9IBB2_9GAMM|nr:MFS transporter [Zophobihabitans entericus]QIQ21109.1 MFS transporter [Zophobihabitans entericus]